MKRLIAVALTVLLCLAARRVLPPEGLHGVYYQSLDWNSAPVLSTTDAPPSTLAMLAAWGGQAPNIFSATWSGTFVALRNGVYTFASASDDGSWIYVDGTLVVDNGGVHAERVATGTIALNRGVHTIFIKYFQNGALLHFALSWSRNGAPLQAVPAWALSPRHPAFGTFVAIVVSRELLLFGAIACGVFLILGVGRIIATAWLDILKLAEPGSAGVRELRASDVAGSAAAGVLALAVYVRTLAPGLYGDVDAPMFQFIGRVLGVAHNPGYPLYVLITHPFSYLPIGSLAYRINLFSGLMGAVTVALVFLMTRQLGCRGLIALAACLGLAFGDVFWAQSVIAEIYTMNSAIVAGMLAALLAWGRTRRASYFYAAVALFSAGLAHHTDIVCFLPGIVIYAWVVDRRFVTRVGTLAGVAGVIAAGLSLYLFVLVRSWQPDAYVESPARTIPELIRVVRGQQFSDHLFVFSARQVITERVPLIVGQIVVHELTLAAFVFAMAGVWLLVRRGVGQAALLVTGCAATLVFVLNYSVIDAQVFVIPATLILWICAAVGAEYVARFLDARGPAIAVAFIACVVAVPLWNLAQNFPRNDLSHSTADAEFFDRFFEALPDRAFIVKEDFVVDRMVSYKLLGEQAAHGRQIVLAREGEGGARIREYAAQGFAVFAFSRMAGTLRDEGFEVLPFPLPGRPGSLTIYSVRPASRP